MSFAAKGDEITTVSLMKSYIDKPNPGRLAGWHKTGYEVNMRRESPTITQPQPPNTHLMIQIRDNHSALNSWLLNTHSIRSTLREGKSSNLLAINLGPLTHICTLTVAARHPRVEPPVFQPLSYRLSQSTTYAAPRVYKNRQLE